MKYLIIAFISLSFTLQVNAQSNISIFINNKKATDAAIKSDQKEIELQIDKSKQKKYDPFIILISGEYVSGEMYKRSLEMSGENSLIIEETKNKPGHFDISKSKAVKDLNSGKKIELYLQLDPANPAMLFPSRRIYMGTVCIR